MQTKKIPRNKKPCNTNKKSERKQKMSQRK